MTTTTYLRDVHASHLRLGFLSGNCQLCDYVRQARREAACSHPKLTPDYVRGEIAKCYRYWDSFFSHMTCPDCGWAGYPEVDDDTETVVFLDEPRGAGDD